jgi:hypothetical protein
MSNDESPCRFYKGEILGGLTDKQQLMVARFNDICTELSGHSGPHVFWSEQGDKLYWEEGDPGYAIR